jgi:hypothetical protein
MIGERPVGLSAVAPTGVTVQASDDSCLADAQRRLYRDLPAWFRARVTADNLGAAVMNAVWRDPRYLAAQREWARCMNEAGVPVATPHAARIEAQRRTVGLTPGQARQVEVDLAGVEARCAVQTGFGDTVRDLDRQYTVGAEAAHADQLDTYRRLQLSALPYARTVLTTPPAGR